MSRRRREEMILEVVEEEAIHTQEELVEALRARGVEVSQSTVSRDVKRLGLAKVPAGEGRYRYGRPGSTEGRSEGATGHLSGVVSDFVTGTAEGRAVLALKTPPGGAHPVAVALDRADLPEVAATVAGDDTLFVLVRDEEALEALRKRIEAWM